MTESSSPETPAQTARDLLKHLQKQYRVIRDSMPLAIGVDKQLIEREPAINRKLLRTALGIHTRSVRYLKALQTATQRYNLDETPAGDVSDTQRTLASDKLLEHFKKRAAEHRTAEAERNKAAREAEAEQQRTEKLLRLQEKFSHR